MKRKSRKSQSIFISLIILIWVFIPVEEIKEQRQLLQGFHLPGKEELLIIKQRAYSDRRLSLKGRKDLIDIFSLITLSDFDWSVYFKLIKRYRLIQYIDDLMVIISKTTELEELGLNRHKISRLKTNLLGKLPAHGIR